MWSRGRARARAASREAPRRRPSHRPPSRPVAGLTRGAGAKLLRVRQEREFWRLGGLRPIRATVRVIAATNRDLPEAVARGQFRLDLYYRLNVFDIRIPPLRERREDIVILTQ